MSERDFLGYRIFDGPVSGPQVAKNVIGDAAERLVARAIGARVWDSRLPAFPIPKEVATESDGSPYELLPDAWWGKQSGFVEVKCGIARFYTTERQWKAYRWARDTQRSGLPVDRPRVLYAFVGYRLTKRTDKYAGTHDILDDALRGLRYVVVADSRLVETYIAESGSYHTDHAGPLSPMLGIWHAHWNVRAHRLQTWADKPREQLAARALTRWSASCFKATFRAAADELAGNGWASIPDIPAVILAPRRRPRPGTEHLPGTQETLFGHGACPECGFYGPLGDCPGCGTFTAF